MRQTKWMTATMIRNGRKSRKEKNKCVSQFELIQYAPPTALNRFQRLLTMQTAIHCWFFFLLIQ